MFAAALTVASITAIATGHAHEIKLGNLVIVHPWSRQMPNAADVAAGFMKIINKGTEDDRLVKVTAEISDNVQLHDMKMEGDIMKMVELPDGIPIPAGETVELKPKSLHVMFLDLKSQPVANTEFRGTLTFEKAGTVDVDFEVEESGGGMEGHD
jgi:copper(I)-binding protein